MRDTRFCRKSNLPTYSEKPKSTGSPWLRPCCSCFGGQEGSAPDLRSLPHCVTTSLHLLHLHLLFCFLGGEAYPTVLRGYSQLGTPRLLPVKLRRACSPRHVRQMSCWLAAQDLIVRGLHPVESGSVLSSDCWSCSGDSSPLPPSGTQSPLRLEQ